MKNDVVLLAHGSGGGLYHQLVNELFVPAFYDKADVLADSAVLNNQAGDLAFTTDSFVVQPRKFSGGDIGHLAVCGTVNDLAVSGAVPKYLSAGFIIEEGLSITELKDICASMAKTAKEAGVAIVTGDTKVVKAGQADGIYINTAGIGFMPKGRKLDSRLLGEGDVIILSGTMGDHGATVMAAREAFAFSENLQSDAVPLNGLIEVLLKAVPNTKVLRDPTRGGVATTLNEWCEEANVTIELEEAALPIKPEVQSFCDILGLEPLYVANEGKFLVGLPQEFAEAALKALKSHPLGKDAAVIGRVTKNNQAQVYLNTAYGSQRILQMLSGAQLPRIC
ncbi:MAG: hydrogenase expression/formation protein HypE [Clostridia bacterium]|jgi:hydrogenase expression/formation protein HypE|nr:hydrogenase expression/formation protein HypE [Clostridia bacterium]MDD4572234.1 hydrogenase expression/formation protein HypE [Clostridia bacterium]